MYIICISDQISNNMAFSYMLDDLHNATERSKYVSADIRRNYTTDKYRNTPYVEVVISSCEIEFIIKASIGFMSKCFELCVWALRLHIQGNLYITTT